MKKIKYQKDIKLFVNNSILDELKQCVSNAYPHEACGIILGDINQIELEQEDFQYHYIARKFACIPSNRESPVAFLIDNIMELDHIIRDNLKTYREKSNQGIRLISIFHSHPAGSFPSSVDYKQMKFLDDFSGSEMDFVSKAFKNLIWTIMDASTSYMNAFIYFEKKLQQVELEIRS